MSALDQTSLRCEGLTVRDKVTSRSAIDKYPYVLQHWDYAFHLKEKVEVEESYFRGNHSSLMHISIYV